MRFHFSFPLLIELPTFPFKLGAANSTRRLAEARQAEKNQHRQQNDQEISDHDVLPWLRSPHFFLLPALALPLDQLDDVFGVDAAGDELRAGSAHHAERLFALVVDERDVAEVHDAFARVAPTVRVLPTGFEFRNPRRNEAALQNPALLGRAIGDRDPQHCVFLSTQ